MSYSKGIISFMLFIIATHAYHRLSSKRKKALHKKEIYDVLMFSCIEEWEKVACRFSRSLVHPSTDRLLNYLSLPVHTLDICMYMITYNDVAFVLQKLHNSGVRVRCIVDADMAYATGSATKRIERQGIELRWMKSTNLMHHKFCLVDASFDIDKSDTTPFAMIGSLNWTNQAVSGNWENVLVTSKTKVVQSLQMEFDKLWLKFKPIDK